MKAANDWSGLWQRFSPLESWRNMTEGRMCLRRWQQSPMRFAGLRRSCNEIDQKWPTRTTETQQR